MVPASARVWLGVDVGTGAIKAGAYGPDGRLLCAGRSTCAIASPSPGTMVQDPDRDWWQGAVRALRVITAAVDPQTIGGVGVCGHFPSLCLLDGQGRSVGPAYLYGDTRAHDEAEEITAATGLELRGDEVAPRLRWLSRYRPDESAQARLALGSGGLVVYRLTGVASIDPHTAARWGCPLNTARDNWDAARTEPLGLDPDALPPVKSYTQIVGVVTAAASAITGLAAGTPVVTGATDTFAVLLGHRVLDPEDSFLYYGSSGFLAVLSRSLEDTLNDPRCPPPGEPYQLDRFVPNSGLLVEGLHMALGRPYGDLDSLAARVPPGADGVFAFPPIGGGPGLPQGCLIGVTLDHHAGHIWRAALEALGYPLVGFRPSLGQVVSGGGGARSPVWRQVISDMTGLRQRFDAQGSGTLGAALLGMLGTGHLASIRQAGGLRCWADDAAWTDAEPARQDRYEELHSAWTGLQEALRPSQVERGVPASRRTLIP